MISEALFVESYNNTYKFMEYTNGFPGNYNLKRFKTRVIRHYLDAYNQRFTSRELVSNRVCLLISKTNPLP